MSSNLTPDAVVNASRISGTNRRSIVVRMGVALLSRLMLNTARRMIYTFAPAFSRGLGVPLTSITSLIAVNQASGLTGPIFGPFGDRYGYRTMMLAGLAMLTLGMLAGGMFPYYAVIVFAMLVSGLAKVLFDPALQAYVGARVPYRRRGLAMGVIEMAWAGSTLIGIPLVGLLIASYGWQSPLLVLAGFGVIAFVAIATSFPRHESQHAVGMQDKPIQLAKLWKQLSQDKVVLGALGFSALSCAANDILFVMYAAWLESTFGLTVVALGLATTVIGLAELTGEGLTAALADRIGLDRAALIGMVLSTLSYLLLPTVGHSLPLALGVLFAIFLTFEFTIVTTFSFFTEVLPNARATFLSSNLAALSLGRMLGALAGGALWISIGVWGTSLSAAVVSGIGLVCLGWAVYHWRKERRQVIAQSS